MIYLNKKHYIAKGSNRACYQHPENKKLCIKIMHSNQPNTWLCKEIAYYNKIQKEHKKYSLNFYAKYYGTVKTNFGTGYVYDLFRDSNDSVSLTLKYYFEVNNIFSGKEFRSSILKLQLNISKYKVFCGDMGLNNIIVNITNNGVINLVIVDGLGGGLRDLGNIKNNKHFLKSNFLYFYFDIGIEHNINLDFIRGHSKIMTPLKAINNFYSSVAKRNTLNCTNKEIFYCFKKSIRNNIDVITYDFEKVHPLLLVYYLRYKVKKWFKK